jgi:hypothetical protein
LKLKLYVKYKHSPPVIHYASIANRHLRAAFDLRLPSGLDSVRMKKSHLPSTTKQAGRGAGRQRSGRALRHLQPLQVIRKWLILNSYYQISKRHA